jgi:class 3 adenylate cyclase
VDLALVKRIREASGSSDATVDEDDLEMLKRVRIALDAGLPADALLQVLRVYADALGRVAETEARLFHFYVRGRLKAAGLSGPELFETSRTARERLAPMIEPMILYAHRKAMAWAMREDLVLHFAQDAALPTATEEPGQLRVAIVFVDLSSFTALTDAMGDAVAARVVERFSELVREAANRWEGRVVDRIGDAFLLAFPEPRSALGCALEIERRAASEPQFPAVRSGVHWGPALYREGGYVGTSLNIAARVAAEAQRHQTLVTAAVRTEAAGLPAVEFVPLGKRRLRGLAEELELFEARSTRAAPERKAVDPVCGMEMGPAEVAARLSLGGRERAFCSEKCLRVFLANPERYELRCS